MLIQIIDAEAETVLKRKRDQAGVDCTCGMNSNQIFM